MKKEYIAVIIGAGLLVGFLAIQGQDFGIVAYSAGQAKSLMADMGVLVDTPASATLSSISNSDVPVSVKAVGGLAQNVPLLTFMITAEKATFAHSFNIKVKRSGTGSATLGGVALYAGDFKLADGKTNGVTVTFTLDRNLELLSGDPRTLVVKATIQNANTLPTIFRSEISQQGVKGSPSSPIVVKPLVQPIVNQVSVTQ